MPPPHCAYLKCVSLAAAGPGSGARSKFPAVCFNTRAQIHAACSCSLMDRPCWDCTIISLRPWTRVEPAVMMASLSYRAASSPHRISVFHAGLLCGTVFFSLLFSTPAAVRNDVQSGSLLGDYFPGKCRSFSELHMNMCRERLEADYDLWWIGKPQLCESMHAH